jgi:hypothetical protein
VADIYLLELKEFMRENQGILAPPQLIRLFFGRLSPFFEKFDGN